ncbi:MAG: phytoene desaturase [Saprospiraceae bacterium]|nr:phytoene desaturase [Saprospiraceae bacterium]
MPKNKNIGIIGSGVAGLATAIRLALDGNEVTVYEKNIYPGGKLTNFESDGFQFDAGPSLFTQPQNIEELFSLAGKNINQYFKYISQEVACSYFFESGKTLKAYTDSSKFADELHAELGEDREKVLSYLKDSADAYFNIGHIFLNKSLQKFSTWIHSDILKALKSTKLSYLFSSLNQYNQHHFSTVEAVQIFNRFATYNGSNPYTAPAMLSMIPHLEQNEGTFYPLGGMISITNALYLLAQELGVHFNFNNNVETIVHKDSQVKGLISHEKFYAHDLIVSNIDVYYTYKKLLNNSAVAGKIAKQERSSSAIIYYWGINKSFDNLGLHNIFFSNDYKDEFDHIFKKKSLCNDPTIYVNITSKIDKSHAPPNKENWFVMVNTPNDSGQNWEELREKCKKSVIEKMNSLLNIDIESCIQTEAYLDPTMIDLKTGSYTGSLYGTSSNNRFAAFLRHANWSKDIKGLYFVGGSVHPGGGIPLCLKSAKITSDIIKNDYTL